MKTYGTRIRAHFGEHPFNLDLGQPACKHPAHLVKDGPTVPVRNGSAGTQICACGAWRYKLGLRPRWHTDSALQAPDASWPT